MTTAAALPDFGSRWPPVAHATTVPGDSADPAAMPPALRRASDRLLLRAARRGGLWLVPLFAVPLVLSAVETVLPAALGRGLDEVLAGTGTTWLVVCAGLITVLVLGDVLDDIADGAITARATAWLRHRLLAHVLALGTRARRFGAGEMSTRVVSNAADAGRAAPELVWGFADLIPAVGGVVALALIDPWLCLTFLAGVPLLMVLLRSFVRESTDVTTHYLRAQGRISDRLTGALAGSRTIAAAGTLDTEVHRVLTPLPELRRHGMRMWHTIIRISWQDALLMPLLQVAVLAVGGYLLTRGRISPGELLAASQYVLLSSDLDSVVPAMSRLTRARAAAARVAEVFQDPAPFAGSEVLPPGRGRLEFRGVTVRKDDRVVLREVNLEIPGGALVAVVGRSGSGKSLLAALAGRLADPDEGTVLLDGVPLPELRREELRRAIGFGFERPVLIGETVAEAIGLGLPTPSAEAVEQAAWAAQADTFVRHLPQGYRTRLAEAPLSGGEVQRIGLARAFAHAERVLVLDDVAASLDTVTEHQIHRVLTGALADRTRLVVAHRASTAARADLVVWLDEGRVRAVAPHAQLQADPDYRALFEAAPLGNGATEGATNGVAGRAARNGSNGSVGAVR